MKVTGELQIDCPSDRAHQENYLSGLIAEVLIFLNSTNSLQLSTATGKKAINW